MIYFYLTALSLFTGVFSQNDNCREKFRGTWKYDKYAKEVIFVERTDDLQKEITSNGKYEFSYSIEWLSDCEYELTFIGTTSPKGATINVGEKLNVKILQISDSTMTYRSTFRDAVDTGTMKRLN